LDFTFNSTPTILFFFRKASYFYINIQKVHAEKTFKIHHNYNNIKNMNLSNLKGVLPKGNFYSIWGRFFFFLENFPFFWGNFSFFWEIFLFFWENFSFFWGNFSFFWETVFWENFSFFWERF
jgi:hypothetical protein